MKCFIVILALIVISPFSRGQANQEKIYVCTPCGYACDSVDYKSPGTCGTCGMSFVEKSTVNFENITFAEMCERVKKNKGALLLDVRSPGEFTGENKSVRSFGHLKNAININVNDLSTRMRELDAYKDKEVIVYCSHSHRSPQATYMMTNNDFKNVVNVLGGVSILQEQFSDNSCVSKLFVKHEQ